MLYVIIKLILGQNQGWNNKYSYAGIPIFFFQNQQVIISRNAYFHFRKLTIYRWCFDDIKIITFVTRLKPISLWRMIFLHFLDKGQVWICRRLSTWLLWKTLSWYRITSLEIKTPQILWKFIEEAWRKIVLRWKGKSLIPFVCLHHDVMF